MSTTRYHVVHETVYEYAAPVPLSQHLLHLSPRELALQQVHSHQLEIEPTAAEQARYLDWFGNPMVWLAVRTPHTVLRLLAASVIEVQPRPGAWRQALGPAWETVVAAVGQFPATEPLEVQECALPSLHVPLNPAVRDWALSSFPPSRPLLEAARELMARIYQEFTFDPEASTVATSVATTFARQRGVCQDFAHLMLSALRSLGLAARYMSGYLLTNPPPGQPRLIGADASHAWVSLWCPGVGWVDFDPTNNVQPDLEHVVLGWGRDFADVTPMRGVILGGGAHQVRVHVTVMPAALRSMESLLAEVRAKAVSDPANARS
ncbi:Transglutaminase-like enzyme, predicted cysteine protease [Candidatus Competibacter denitrificans Run_A_D11]|uniref:Transglutaminase-like enzyme, predicted cysteine protease n=1 Tax=Candidatus Competibacter denitrificans Run_A_D11 TaxID=1400863 RepID=W6MBK1_9GAMM|nr:transglutaminase family protein [Candidatus Competibacter denitrificans]CDI01358.1 Transglutaminase-like enzyme, predicted cysteine protease [Candidatus Competibacter denitrificans Run_A_D11]HRC69197.1 transglutaminase family protein [Candidatus Competibacter denitrificans]